MSYATNQRDRGKAEVFELALARVSRQVAVLAGQAAAELKAERLAAARAGGSGPGDGGDARRGADRPAGRRPAAVKTTGGTKKDASTPSQTWCGPPIRVLQTGCGPSTESDSSPAD